MKTRGFIDSLYDADDSSVCDNNTVIPYDAEAESGALACILSAGDKSHAERMLAELSEADFYDLRHLTILRLAQSLQLDSKPLNMLEVIQLAKSNGELDNCGGFDYLQRLPDASPSPEIFPTFRRVVKEFAERRNMFVEAKNLRARALDLTAPVNVETKSSLPPLVDAASFVEESLPEPPQLIAGILHQGCKLALAGGSKSFKTFTLLDLALSVCCGLPWLNFKTHAAPVLFVNFELQLWTIQQRIKEMAQAKEITLTPNKLTLLNLRGKAAPYNVILREIKERVKSKFGLIILDPIYKLYAVGGKENEAGDMAQVLNAIESLTDDTGSSVVFGSHFSKGNQAGKESIDRISGSGVFARDPDTILTFTQHQTQECFTVDATLRAFKPVSPFVVRWDYPLMRPDADLNPDDLKRVAGRKPKHDTKKFLAAIANNDEQNPISINGWAKQMGVARTSLKEHVTEMQKKGWIKTIGEGSQSRQAITNKGKDYLNE